MALLAHLRPLVVALLLLIVAPMPAAWAHAQLLSTEPTQNAILEAAPATIALIFNEPVSPLALRLIGPDGETTEVEAAGGVTVTVPLPPGLGRGTHVLSYRVVSTDGHPIGGSLIFSIGEATDAQAAPSGDPAVAVALWAGKAVLFLAMFVGIGGGVFLVVGDLPRQARVLAVGLSVTGVFAAAVTTGLQGLDALGLPLGSFLDGAAWSAALSTSYGFTAIVAGVAFLAAVGALTTPAGREATGLGMAAGVLAALSLALSGHASAAAPQWLTRPAVFLHIAGVLFWVGALVPLWLLLRDGSASAERALARFSRIIPFAVAPLALSGLVLATVQLGWPGPQWLTGYGFILAAKLGLLVVLFGLAVWNRRFLTAPALAGDDMARRRLHKSIGAETAIVMVILALVAGWRFTPPPRALAAAASAPAVTAEPLMLHLGDTKTMAMVTISPAMPGPVSLDIYISDLEGMPKEVQSVTATINSPQLGVEPLNREATGAGDGTWTISDFAIPLAGAWEMEVDIRVSRFELAKLRTEFRFPPEEGEVVEEVSYPATVFGDLSISRAFLRATLPNAPVGGAYLTITNTGTAEERLVEATSPAAKVVTLHGMELKDDIMRMRDASGGFVIGPGQSITLEPSGMHLMLNGLTGPLVEGTTVPITLMFETAGAITLDVPVAGFAATRPPEAARGP